MRKPEKMKQLLKIAIILYSLCWTSCQNSQTSFPPEIEMQLPEEVDFNYHVRPILSDKCYACHGPDENKVQGGLRLDIETRALAELESGAVAIIPGKPGQSELIHRIQSIEEAQVMPPPESNLQLSEYERAILIRWIEEGAVYKPHWSFIPPKSPALPVVNSKNWINSPIDAFILARLEKENLTPAQKAEKVTLIRRLSFDLTGLPPTLEEIDNFLTDDSEDSYEKLVDRLLDSKHYGERMAMDWLDIARYADSHGFHADGYRMMWPWRDWVIKAFNQNLPFNEFITWQMAGDLIPEATQEQKLATGFHRNHPINSESGIVPEEYRLENVFDRTNTTSKAFLGLTMECARCHDHKYDPISQKEFFQFAAFFNNVEELGMMSVDGNAEPTMLLMDEEVEKIADFIRSDIIEQEQKLNDYSEKSSTKQEVKAIKFNPQFLQDGLVGHIPLDHFEEEKTPNIADPKHNAHIRGEIEVVKGKSGSALWFDSNFEHLSVEGIGDFERTESFSMGAWIYPGTSDEEYRAIMGNAGHKNEHWRGYELLLDSTSRVAVRLVHRPPGHGLYVNTVDSIPIEKWSHVFFTYDGSSNAEGIRVYIGGKSVPLEVRHNHLKKSIRTIDAKLNVKSRPLRIGRSYRIALEQGIFDGAVDDIRIYDRRLTDIEVMALTKGQTLHQTANELIAANNLEPISQYYLHQYDENYQAIQYKLASLRRRESALFDSIPEVMVMQEMNKPRKMFVLDRGVYDAPKEEVFPGTPKQVLPFPESFPTNRLGLAKWLTSEKNPLTARVLVNHYWQLLFGKGIVKTSDDFGNQGALPSHPKLLDWLAVEFVRSGWNLKALIKLMVTSSTYRQSSVASQELKELDPDNKWLARSPVYRLPAEMIRDNALKASGLLVNTVGGPSVKTYQPEGLWDNTHFSKLLTHYTPDRGRNLYRRSLYTFVRRTAPPPTMTIMDASDRSMCVVQRQNTNTPLQALLLLNEPQLIEAARTIAERAIREADTPVNDQLNYIFRLLTGRHLLEEEIPHLKQLYEEEHKKYMNDRESALELLQVGVFPRDEDLPVPEVAALTIVANVIMNYDESNTKR